MYKDRETSSHGEKTKEGLSKWTIIAGTCCLVVAAIGGGGYAAYFHRQTQKFNTLLTKGNVAFQSHKWNTALGLYKQAESIRNNSEVSTKIKQTAQAIQTQFNTLLNKGDSAFQSHKWTTALGVYKQAQSIQSNSEISTKIQQTGQAIQWSKTLSSNNLTDLNKLYTQLQQLKSTESSFVNPFINETNSAMVNTVVSQMKLWFPDYFQSNDSIKFETNKYNANETTQTDQSNLKKSVDLYNQIVNTTGEPLPDLRDDIYKIASAAQTYANGTVGTNYKDARSIVNIVEGIVTPKELSSLQSVVVESKKRYETSSAVESAALQSSNSNNSDVSNGQTATQAVNQAENNILTPPTTLSYPDTQFLEDLGSFVEASNECYFGYIGQSVSIEQIVTTLQNDAQTLSISESPDNSQLKSIQGTIVHAMNQEAAYIQNGSSQGAEVASSSINDIYSLVKQQVSVNFPNFPWTY